MHRNSSKRKKSREAIKTKYFSRLENKKVFPLTLDFNDMPVNPLNEDGEIINPDFNARTYMNKALKAYIKGDSHFRYLGKLHKVPRATKQQILDMLDSIETNKTDIDG